jgi:hypothetical protein
MPTGARGNWPSTITYSTTGQPIDVTMNSSHNPPRLTIPTTSASPSSTAAVQTGRPPLWTLSSQRKMCRLYLYTTLKIEEILDVVYHNQLDNAPGYVGFSHLQ